MSICKRELALDADMYSFTSFRPLCTAHASLIEGDVLRIYITLCARHAFVHMHNTLEAAMSNAALFSKHQALCFCFGSLCSKVCVHQPLCDGFME